MICSHLTPTPLSPGFWEKNDMEDLISRLNALDALIADLLVRL